MADKTNAELLKEATAQLEKVSSDFSKQAEAAMQEAKQSGQLSAETKEAVDRIATQHNGLAESVKTLQASLGELHVVFRVGVFAGQTALYDLVRGAYERSTLGSIADEFGVLFHHNRGGCVIE